MKVLNLYSGLGGNRKLWKDVEVTAVEIDEKIAAVYSQNFPVDKMIIGDAHKYLLDHYKEFEFIWISPPCQGNTRMIRSGRNRKPRYPDLTLYEEIIFLKHNFTGPWVVENVKPYYEPLIKPTAILGRHCLWTNFPCSDFHIESPKGFITKSTLADVEILKKWLGIHYEGSLYYNGNHCPGQVLRNCVHPDLGLHVFEQSKVKQTLFQ